MPLTCDGIHGNNKNWFTSPINTEGNGAQSCRYHSSRSTWRAPSDLVGIIWIPSCPTISINWTYNRNHHWEKLKRTVFILMKKETVVHDKSSCVESHITVIWLHSSLRGSGNFELERSKHVITRSEDLYHWFRPQAHAYLSSQQVRHHITSGA